METLNPVWMETFYFITNNSCDNISLEVFDYNKLSNDQVIGVAEIDMSKIIHATIEDDCEIFHAQEITEM
jgi:Ca2+-dependent lipid-binding protein